jgi:hypothetical protein
MTGTTTPEMIAAEKTRILDRIAKLDVERDRLSDELGDIVAYERVAAKFSSDTTSKKPNARARKATDAAARQRAGKSKADYPSESVEVDSPPTTSTTVSRPKKDERTIKLGDAILQAVGSYPVAGATVPTIQAFLKERYGLTVRTNHLSIGLQRHLKANRLEKRNDRWYQTDPEMFRAAA